ncbi:MAG: type IV secretory system conjugative DNA transfer family protein [Phycisphaerales bacterium]
MLRLTQHDFLSARDLFEGTLVLGNPGSGKTSTTGTALPMAALQAGWGVVAYCTKPDDAAFFERLCRESGRLPQLRIIRPDGRTHFNLIRYELQRPSQGGGNTLKLAALLTEVFREGNPASAATDSSEFFDRQAQILLCNTLDALRLADEPLSFESIGRLIESIPKDPSERETDQWRRSFCCEVLMRADQRTRDTGQERLFEVVSSYCLVTVPNMNERTRGDVFATVESALFQLNRDPVRDLLDSPDGCDFVPEMLEDAAVLVIDCPVSVYGPVGRMLTICFKRLVKEMARRRVSQGDATRPILSFADEAQTYATRDDADFQQVCRSNRIATVFLTQSIDNFTAVLGNEAHTNSLAGALTNLVVHATAGHNAEWVQNRIASAWRSMESVNLPGRNPEQPPQSPGMNLSESLHPQVLASELTRLRTGGPRNNGLVDAVIFKPGRAFHASGGAPFVRVTFQQS